MRQDCLFECKVSDYMLRTLMPDSVEDVPLFGELMVRKCTCKGALA